MSFTGLLCGHPAGGIRHLQRTQAPWCLDLLPIPREVGRCSGVCWCDTAFSCSPKNYLSKVKTGSSLKSQDRVRALQFVYLFVLGLNVQIGLVIYLSINLGLYRNSCSLEKCILEAISSLSLISTHAFHLSPAKFFVWDMRRVVKRIE